MANARCPQCGADQPPGTECETCFHALLAFENEHPSVFGAVHHLTVAAYYLQHPIGYSREALEAWRTLLAEALDGRSTVDQLRERHGKQFAGSKRVREPNALPPAYWPHAWRMIVSHVLDPLEPPPNEAQYVERARAWATTTRNALDAAHGASGDQP